MLSVPTGLFTGIQLDERCVHKCENPETNQTATQKQAKQNDRPKETWKKGPIKAIQTTTRVTLSLNPPVCVHTYCTLFLLNNYASHCFPSLRKFFSAKLKGQGLVTGH